MPIEFEVETTVHREYDGRWRGQAIVTIYEDGNTAWVVPHGCEHARLTRERAEKDALVLATSLRR